MYTEISKSAFYNFPVPRQKVTTCSLQILLKLIMMRSQMKIVSLLRQYDIESAMFLG